MRLDRRMRHTGALLNEAVGGEAGEGEEAEVAEDLELLAGPGARGLQRAAFSPLWILSFAGHFVRAWWPSTFAVSET